jgi:hypothetical protein
MTLVQPQVGHPSMVSSLAHFPCFFLDRICRVAL